MTVEKRLNTGNFNVKCQPQMEGWSQGKTARGLRTAPWHVKHATAELRRVFQRRLPSCLKWAHLSSTDWHRNRMEALKAEEVTSSPSPLSVGWPNLSTKPRSEDVLVRAHAIQTGIENSIFVNR